MFRGTLRMKLQGSSVRISTEPSVERGWFAWMLTEPAILLAKQNIAPGIVARSPLPPWDSFTSGSFFCFHWLSCLSFAVGFLSQR